MSVQREKAHIGVVREWSSCVCMPGVCVWLKLLTIDQQVI